MRSRIPPRWSPSTTVVSCHRTRPKSPRGFLTKSGRPPEASKDRGHSQLPVQPERRRSDGHGHGGKARKMPGPPYRDLRPCEPVEYSEAHQSAKFREENPSSPLAWLSSSSSASPGPEIQHPHKQYRLHRSLRNAFWRVSPSSNPWWPHHRRACW